MDTPTKILTSYAKVLVRMEIAKDVEHAWRIIRRIATVHLDKIWGYNE